MCPLRLKSVSRYHVYLVLSQNQLLPLLETLNLLSQPVIVNWFFIFSTTDRLGVSLSSCPTQFSPITTHAPFLLSLLLALGWPSLHSILWALPSLPKCKSIHKKPCLHSVFYTPSEESQRVKQKS